MATIVTGAMSGNQCSFKTKNPNDTQVWQGTISGTNASYAVASAFRAILPYNNAVRATDSTVSTDLTKLTYFILAIPQQDTSLNPVMVAFAQEWIVDGSFSLITNDVPVSIEVYMAPTGSSQAILDYLWQGGYKAYLSN